MSNRELLHRMIDQLPDAEIHVALRFVEYLRHTPQDDPLLQRLSTAEEDPEPLAPAEAAAVDRALDEIRAGQVVSWEEVRARIG